MKGGNIGHVVGIAADLSPTIDNEVLAGTPPAEQSAMIQYDQYVRWAKKPLKAPVISEIVLSRGVHRQCVNRCVRRSWRPCARRQAK